MSSIILISENITLLYYNTLTYTEFLIFLTKITYLKIFRKKVSKCLNQNEWYEHPHHTYKQRSRPKYWFIWSGREEILRHFTAFFGASDTKTGKSGKIMRTSRDSRCTSCGNGNREIRWCWWWHLLHGDLSFDTYRSRESYVLQRWYLCSSVDFRVIFLHDMSEQYEWYSCNLRDIT